MRRCQVLIQFQGEILTVEELGGINSHFICFNPDRSSGRPDYKIHFSEKMLLRFEGETKLISIMDYPEEFVIVNSSGKVLTDSKNTSPEFVDHLMDDIIENAGLGKPRKDLN